MTNDFLHYLLEQSSGVVIAIILIMRMDTKLDQLNGSINHLAEIISGHLKKDAVEADGKN